uniref:Uncharacterized protein n=1 Tax=Alexandrium catenella TaxID=2925 RepID=A0A7S1LHX9_ALECA|mmetsp:Transcript_113980/g.302938  ORF Transcript_113980/g.302938 Transcript_113980/m.302938 type:complete len:287 (+) Transcript_113980:87-947(+)
MADRGRVGSLIVGSKSCAEKCWRKDHDLHRAKLRQSRSAVDISSPATLAMDHFRNNLKRERLLEDRYVEIDRENQVLLKKMSDQMKKPNPYLKEGPENKPTSLNRTSRKKELQSITKENRRMLKAIQEVKPVYSVKNWDENYKKSAVLLRNCSSYPVITRLPRERSTSSVLMQLDPEADGSGSLSHSRQGSPQIRSGEDHDDPKYVLKEGKRIGATYYLLEMSTDGRVLNISAYDGETQTSLELVVKEKIHRLLYRELNGDYAAVADRLKVDNSRLILDTSGLPGA